MSANFCLSIRFLDHRFHGRRDGGEPEWPPSPLRVFQALVATAARLGGGGIAAPALDALRWLEQQETAPLIIAPPALLPDTDAPGYCLSVPNNAMDIVAGAWCRGNYTNKGDASPATHRSMKTVRPVHCTSDDPVSYVWPLVTPLSREIRNHLEQLTAVARKLVQLGWGIDLVVGDAALLSDDQVKRISGEQWRSSSHDAIDGLRVPVLGTMDDLLRRYNGFLVRLVDNLFTPPPPLSVYRKADYRRAVDSPARSVAVFSLLKPDMAGFRMFDTTKRALTVAGMMRHAAGAAAEQAGWPASKIARFVQGHGESVSEREHVSVGNSRFAYLPLPTIEARGKGQSSVVGGIRRIMLTTFGDIGRSEILWARSALSGQELFPEKSFGKDKTNSDAVAVLAAIPHTDTVAKTYLRASATWATVTPVILPGFDDPAHYRRRLKRSVVSTDEQKRLWNQLSARVDGLIRKAITQAGFTQFLADHAIVEWRKVGYWRGVEQVNHYGVPDHLKRFPSYHIKITWCDEQQRPLRIRGPVCIGGGRFYGIGLFAALPSTG